MFEKLKDQLKQLPVRTDVLITKINSLIKKLKEDSKPAPKQYWKWTWWRIGYALENIELSKVIYQDHPKNLSIIVWIKIIGRLYWKDSP